jgi:NIPSNAP
MMPDMLHRDERQDDRERRNSQETCCPVVELRHYTLKPGRQDELIALFEEQFVEGQEQYGLRVIGQFRQRGQPDAFIWLRGFADMDRRRHALEGFYYGPIWREHRTAANDTMLDSDDVLLLRPATPTAGFRLHPGSRPAPDAPESGETMGGLVIATIYSFAAPVEERFVAFFTSDVTPVLRASGATLLAQFVTEPSENTFPALPVREGEHVFVWFASFADEAAYMSYQTALAQNLSWNTAVASTLLGWLAKPEEVLELSPCRRSLLRHGAELP